MKGLPLAAALLLVALPVCAAEQSDSPDESPDSVMASFRPSVAVVVGIFAVMFSLTFLLLIYAKFCHAAAHAAAAARTAAAAHDPDLLPRRAPSGVDKTVIESLPFFRFSSLRGSRDGLECAVCLSAFAAAELLRLLPKCKHAFHLDCVDRWLDSHSSCPLCRCAVDAADAAAFHRSTSSRFLLPSTRRDDSDLDREIELFVEREPGVSTSSRFSLGRSVRKIENFLRNSKQDPAFLAPVHLRHQLKHRIIVSDVVHKRRWSDVNSADLLSLSSDMLGAVSSKRFSDNNGGHLASAAGAPASVESRSLLSTGVRSASEITNYSRFNGVLGRSGRVGRDEASNAKDEKLKTIWLPIARRTVQLFAGREQSSQIDHQIL